MTRASVGVTKIDGGLDQESLLKLRVVVARFGEMDLMGWWNTKGQLGRLGCQTLRRGFPRTHYFAQARSVFSVAGQRCAKWFNPPASATLWSLPADIEETFDTRWEHWLDHVEEWKDFFARVESLKSDVSLSIILGEFGLVNAVDLEVQKGLRRSAEDRALPLPGIFSGTNSDMRALALGFSRGEKLAPTIPYMRLP